MSLTVACVREPTPPPWFHRPNHPHTHDRRPLFGLLAVAVVVAAVEVGATTASLGGDPLVLAEGWAPTRPTDAVAFALTVLGCGALFVIHRFPSTATLVAAGAYAGFMVVGYEFGMSLPAMAATFLVVAGGGRRLVALVAALACLTASVVWIARRTATVVDPQAAVLAWVAFGAVCAVFFALPPLIGEIVRTRRDLAAAHSAIT